MAVIETINIVLILLMFVTLIAIMRVRELVSAVFLLGIFSFFLAVLWALIAAPDVSFTEAMVGVGASTIFLLLALFGSRHTIEPVRTNTRHWVALSITLALALFFVWGSLDLPWLGDVHSAPNAYLSPYYLMNTLYDSATPNAVTGIVVDYRGFDTLIETWVIFTAGAACLLIIRVQRD
jgi:multicomponent Na+:H+ antiporter subunit B